jgi:hypothetical protein
MAPVRLLRIQAVRGLIHNSVHNQYTVCGEGWRKGCECDSATRILASLTVRLNAISATRQCDSASNSATRLSSLLKHGHQYHQCVTAGRDARDLRTEREEHLGGDAKTYKVRPCCWRYSCGALQKTGSGYFDAVAAADAHWRDTDTA